MKTDIIIDKRESRTFVRVLEGPRAFTVEVQAPTADIVAYCRERYGARLGTVIERRSKFIRKVAAA